jgi:hypothetical protein
MKSAMLFLTLTVVGSAQVPTGTIAGVVRDPSGAAVSGVRLTVVNVATKIARSETTSEQGDYSFPALSPGQYDMNVQADSFPSMDRKASVESGATTTADFDLRLGDIKQSLSVGDSTPQVQYDSHSVSGTITGSEIENLPLNGRNFLELAKLEPGVQQPSRTSGNRTYIPVLGGPGGPSGSGTRVTVDGASIMTPAAFGASMGFSQDLVQEFQVSSASFDLSTGLTFSGAVNVATRSGGNDLHGSAFYYFRDHKLSAYPGLQRDPADPDPFFQRQQFGLTVGGPIRRDRLFFFANWEHNGQRGVATSTLFGPDFAHFSSITPTPLLENQISFRLDDRLSSKHTLFVRYSHDGSRAFAAVTGGATTVGNTYPSNWVHEATWADQSLLGVTSILRPTLVNDFRFSYFFYSDDQLPAQQSDCPGCLGIGAPMISIPGLVFGNSSTMLDPGRRFETNESVAWQHGRHRARFGVDGEHNRGGALSWANEPASLTLFSPDQVRTFNQTAAPGSQIPLPAAFNSLNDILQLPLQSVKIDIGDPRVRQANGSLVRTWNTERLYFQDTWRVNQRLTLDGGLAWMMDGYKNYDLPLSAFLAPILGAGGLAPTRRQWKNFSPSLGFAWAPSHDKKTVIRAGAGIYYDFFFQGPDAERALFGPAGSGRQSIVGSAIGNPLSGIAGVPAGTPLNFTGSPTLFTGADLMSILPSIRAQLAASLANAGPSVTNIQILKQAATVNFPTDNPSWSSQQVNVGIEREIARDFVMTADFVFRHFIHGGMGPGGLDLNHFNRIINGVQTPVIPKCTAAQQNNPQAICSTGPIQVWQSTSNQAYKGLLVRADKRFSRHFQMLSSWAWSSNVGTPGSGVQNPYTAFAPLGLNLDQWHQPDRPLVLDYTHIVNLAGVVDLPRHFELGLNFSYSSAPPFSPTVGSGPTGIDFNGDGTTGDLLPGTLLGQFNRGLGKADLARLETQFNQTYALTHDAQGRVIPRITLPNTYSLDHSFQALDLRLSRTFVFRERWRLSLIGEVFNLYNAANLSGYSTDLTSPAFGQPNARFTQLFGSGGPRAFQLAGRISF